MACAGAQGRPEVKVLEAVITPPGYTELPEEIVKQGDGNLTGLVGSIAHLKIQFNMPSRSHVASFESGFATADEQQATVGLRISRSTKMTATKILAVAAETGFDNPLSPQYRIQR